MPFYALILATLAGVPAAQAVPTDTLRPLTAEQAVDVHRIGDLRFSPDGTRLAFVVTEPPGDSTTERHIWMLEVTSGEVLQLTRSPKGEDSPRWSPDGRTLAFLSDRDSVRRVFLLPVDGGEARPLTPGQSAVSRFEWSPDGRRIAYLAPDPKSEERRKRERARDDARVADRDDRHSRLWILDVPSGAAGNLRAPAPVARTDADTTIPDSAARPLTFSGDGGRVDRVASRWAPTGGLRDRQARIG